MRRLLLFIVLLTATSLRAQEPLYVVNGTIVESIEHIPHEDIERIDVLPADEESIARWGTAASEGVILVTLRYDTPARFEVANCNNFTEYLAATVKWDERMPAERVSLRLTIDEQGNATIAEILESTSRQFLKRVQRAIDAAPRWIPATRDGVAQQSIHLVNIQLPRGKQLPTEQGVIIL